MKKSRYSEEQIVAIIRESFGIPEHIRSDNGPESKRSADSLPKAARRVSVARQFIAYAIQDWLKEKKVKTLYITPGAPWEWSSGDIEPSKEAPRRGGAKLAVYASAYGLSSVCKLGQTTLTNLPYYIFKVSTQRGQVSAIYMVD